MERDAANDARKWALGGAKGSQRSTSALSSGSSLKGGEALSKGESLARATSKGTMQIAPEILRASSLRRRNTTASAGSLGDEDDEIVRVSTELGMHEISAFGLRGNPVVICVSLMASWGMVLAAIVAPDAFFGLAAESKRWLTSSFTWLFIASQNVWVFFIIYIALNKQFGELKLGHIDTKPEYSTVGWFFMMFGSAGVGTGLFYYGVGEPILHLTYNRYAAKSYLTYNERSQEAMNLTFYHWGIHAWTCYTVVGITIGITSHRLGLPMTIRSAFFPLFGHAVYGFVGDLIDALSICTTLIAICTSTAAGAIQINTGISLLNPDIPRSTFIHVILVIIMTLMASISVHFGLRHGVRILSVASFMIMISMMIMVALVDDTVFLMNLLVQSTGHHIQWFLQLGFHTDAFEQLTGADVDGKSGPEVWMDWWTVYYWCSWVSWSSLVGIFIAKISKGRKVKELIHCSLTAPVLFSFTWFAVFGGVGLRMERRAVIDACLGNCKTLFKGSPFDRTDCKPMMEGRTAALEAPQTASFLLRRPGGCPSIIQPSSRGIDEMWFDVLRQYDNISNFLVVTSLVCMILFAITTNDSGSIVLDALSGNGPLNHEPTKNIQKQLWSFTLGLMAVILLVAGGDQAISAMQTIIIALGLPYTLLVTAMCCSLYVVLSLEVHPDTALHLTFLEGRYDILYVRDNGMEFWSTSIFGVLSIMDYILSLGSRKSALPSLADWKLFFTAVLAPSYMVALIWVKVGKGDTKALFTLSSDGRIRSAQMIMAFCLFNNLIAVLLLVLDSALHNMWVIGMMLHVFFVFALTGIRSHLRKNYNLGGDMFRDVMAGLFFYPFTLVQMYRETDAHNEGSFDGISPEIGKDL